MTYVRPLSSDHLYNEPLAARDEQYECDKAPWYVRRARKDNGNQFAGNDK